MRRNSNRFPLALGALVAALGVLAPLARARVDSEIVPSEKRKVSVEKANVVAKQKVPAALPETIAEPFAPAGFDLTDAEEAAAAAAAARQANQGNPSIPAPPSDHELLEAIVSKVTPSGTTYFRGSPLLMFGKRMVKTGAHFTVTYKGTDYDLELTQIDGTNFTLRYKSEEITRPIQPGKSP
jgi:hypothetical protein